MPNLKELLTLKQAEQLGYGKADTLKHAIHYGNLKAVKIGREWVTTKKWLNKAGYN